MAATGTRALSAQHDMADQHLPAQSSTSPLLTGHAVAVLTAPNLQTLSSSTTRNIQKGFLVQL